MKSSEKIIWVTQDSFLDTDIEALRILSKHLDIDWHIIFPIKNHRYNDDSIKSLDFINEINLNFHYTKDRLRSPKSILFYWFLIKKIKVKSPDIIYFNLQGFPYFAFICSLLLNRKNVIFAVHQAIVHEGMQYKSITKLYFRFLYSWFINFNLFSESQASIFKKKYRNKRISVIPLGMKNFGESIQSPPDNIIVFLNFGYIIKSKNIGLLIQAACNIYETGLNNFIIKIVGACENWNQYEKLIKYPQLFQLNISTIENEQIPDLFMSSHYFVLPYSAVSQSGQLKIAFNYNIPVVASNLEEFKSEIFDNETGYLFESNNVSALEEVLIKAIKNHNIHYEQLKANQLNDVIKRYSSQSLNEKYIKMFYSITCKNGKNKKMAAKK